MSQQYLLDNRTPEQYKSNVELSFEIQEEWREFFEWKFNDSGYEASFTTVGCDANGFLTDYSKVTSEPDWEVTLTLGNEQVTFPVEFQYTRDYTSMSFFFKENKVNMCEDRGAIIVQALHSDDPDNRLFAITTPWQIREQGTPGKKYKYDAGAKNGFYLTPAELDFHNLDEPIHMGEWLQ